MLCAVCSVQRNCFHVRHKVEQFLNKAIRRLIKDELQLRLPLPLPLPLALPLALLAWFMRRSVDVNVVGN